MYYMVIGKNGFSIATRHCPNVTGAKVISIKADTYSDALRTAQRIYFTR